ncbi:hypothetical protein [Dehalogenimonas etheniformans]|uniref:Uncharacterized protein n=1 Tax=Dehalogenimonas etheniformans TaxID=1536648 RepID=A0A2P5P8E5_9CHLR|nr:hypothetical protein [Dehalogenimonas etheniformans]PPD58572.1 hypothetical protein JP09_001415 [Dehalogenimonas etheniformans]QNT76664.1 hypothetical protein HX448_08205 [Dehalogenimonas etheniformans]
MPDKYSYRPGKKKKSARRQVVVQPVQTEAEIEAELTPTSDMHPIVAIKSATAARPSGATQPAASPSEGRGISRVSNLGAELRRFAVIGSLVVVVLVAAALVLR